MRTTRGHEGAIVVITRTAGGVSQTSDANPNSQRRGASVERPGTHGAPLIYRPGLFSLLSSGSSAPGFFVSNCASFHVTQIVPNRKHTQHPGHFKS